MRSSDEALAAIAEMLPRGWILHSIQMTPGGDYSVLISPSGPVEKSDLGPGGSFPRIFGVGRSVRYALVAAANELARYRVRRGS